MEIIYNSDNLTHEDITDVSVRTKALIIRDNEILLGHENNILEFPGGHLEDKETKEECLVREIREETGIDIDKSSISKPFLKIEYLNKDYPKKGINRSSLIYYYIINTKKEVDLSKVSYTKHEKSGNFKVISVSIDKAIDVIRENIPNNKLNEVIAPDMIIAILEYLKKRSNKN